MRLIPQFATNARLIEANMHPGGDMVRAVLLPEDASTALDGLRIVSTHCPGMAQLGIDIGAMSINGKLRVTSLRLGVLVAKVNQAPKLSTDLGTIGISGREVPLPPIQVQDADLTTEEPGGACSPLQWLNGRMFSYPATVMPYTPVDKQGRVLLSLSIVETSKSGSADHMCSLNCDHDKHAAHVSNSTLVGSLTDVQVQAATCTIICPDN